MYTNQCTRTKIYITNQDFSFLRIQIYRGRIQREWECCMGSYAGVDYITSTYVHFRNDSNAFAMGNPLPELTLTLCQSRLYPKLETLDLFGRQYLNCAPQTRPTKRQLGFLSKSILHLERQSKPDFKTLKPGSRDFSQISHWQDLKKNRVTWSLTDISLAGWSMKVSSASCPSSSTQTLFSPYSSSRENFFYHNKKVFCIENILDF